MDGISLEPAWSDRRQLDRMQTRLARHMVRLCTEQHPWYRERLPASGVTPASIATMEDLEAIPPISKSDLVGAPESFRLDVDPEHPHEYALGDVMYTAGTTTGRPTPIYQTAYDLRAILFAQLRMAKIRGMTPEDRILNLYPLAPLPHGGWTRPSQAAAVLGATVVSATGGAQVGPYPVTRRFEEIVALARRVDPTVVWGVPSYIDRLLRAVADGGGTLPSLRMVAVSGEPCDNHRRATLITLAQAVGAVEPFVSDSLGASELQFSLVECPGGGGFHHPAPELASVDAVDEDGHSVGDGEPGSLCYTHLDRRGTVLMRYLVGDRAVVDRTPCPHCGWTGGRVTELLGREGGFIKIRGALMNVEAAHEAIAATPGVVDHQLSVDTIDGMDALVVDVAVSPEASPEAVFDLVEARVRSATGVRPDVHPASLEEIWRPDERMKPARFTDKRTIPKRSHP